MAGTLYPTRGLGRCGTARTPAATSGLGRHLSDITHRTTRYVEHHMHGTARSMKVYSPMKTGTMRATEPSL